MKNSIILISTIILLFTFSCQQDDAPVMYEKGTVEYTNNWMYEQMKKYYYWNGTMPGKGNISMVSGEYFGYLLNPSDRFSYAINLSDVTTFPKNLRNSFGFDMGFVEHEGQVLGVVLYVLSDSPASYTGLQRGHLVSAINDVLLTHTNYDELYKTLIESQNARLQIMDYTNDSGLSVPYEINVPNGIVLLQPLKSSILQQQNRKVGYVEIPHFDVGLAQSLLNVFQNFKSQSVDDVVVDLRYNGGGDVSSATALAILLAPNIRADDFFIRFTGNENGGVVNQSFAKALETNEQQVTFSALRSAHPHIQRVYVLCGSHTASASEIIINNLRPFMEVITIGEKTVGKDMATFPIENEQAKQHEPQWVLYPAIYKLSNANGEGNYSAGIMPTITLDELGELEIHDLGEPNEVLLERALTNVSGNGRMSGVSKLRTLKQTATDFSEPVLIKKMSPL